MQVKKWSVSEVGWWEENTVVDKKEQRRFRDALILLNSESKSPQTKEKGSSALFVPSHRQPQQDPVTERFLLRIPIPTKTLLEETSIYLIIEGFL